MVMAMAVSCSSAFAASIPSLAVSSASAVSPSGSQWKPAVGPFSGHAVVLISGYGNACVSAVRTVVVKAAGDVIEASTSDASEEPTPAITTMLSEAELLKKKAKKAELRRRRLVRKRKLRKKDTVMAGGLASIAAQVLDELQQVFKAGEDGVAVELVEEIAQARGGHIVVHGVGREGLMMRAFAMRLFHLGLSAHCLGDMSCPRVGEGDLFVVSAGPGSFSSVDALINTAKDAGARVVVVTAQPSGKAPSLAQATIYLRAQTMANDGLANASKKECTAQEQILPMGSVYEGAMFVLFEIVVFLLRKKLGETLETMRARHTNLE